jgi:hypothetical protein
LKQVIEIDAYKLKSAINDAIVTVIKEGYKSLFVIPIQNFMKSLREYNDNRNKELLKVLSDWG